MQNLGWCTTAIADLAVSGSTHRSPDVLPGEIPFAFPDWSSLRILMTTNGAGDGVTEGVAHSTSFTPIESSGSWTS
jgi:hypothetical protein